MVKLTFITFCLIFLGLNHTRAQEIPISNGNLTYCDGFITDTGLSAGAYGPNEDLTLCVCPNEPDKFLQLRPVSVALGMGDTLFIYDGCGTDGALLSTWTSDGVVHMDNANVTATEPGGCLQMHFTSDEAIQGNFSFEIQCLTVCETLDVSFLSNHEGTACLGDVALWQVEWPCSGEGFFEVWGWTVNGQALPNSATNTFEYAIETPGIVEVGAWIALDTEDLNVCSALHLNPQVLHVSPGVSFENVSLPATLCEGDEVVLSADLSPADSGGGGTWPQAGPFPIPDDQTHCAKLNLSLFDGNAVITDPETQIQNVAINMEHSFMGDLFLTLICPNGQSMTLHGQGGGGTFLGEPVDIDSQPNVAGVGYDYAWSPLATNGTWAENGGGTLPSGVYEASGSWSTLTGCPVAGVWQLEACDLWASDNGFVFEWSIYFNESLLSQVNGLGSYALGTSCDSVYWAGPQGEIWCQGSNISPTSSGTYTLNVLDSWGCVSTLETVISVGATGCMDPAAVNYNADAICDDGSCIPMIPTCDFIGHPDWALLPPGWYPQDTLVTTVGAQSSLQAAFRAPSTILDPSNLPIANVTGFITQDIPGLVLAPWDALTPGSQSCFQWEGIPTTPGIYAATLEVTTQVIIFGIPVAGPVYVWPLTIVVNEGEGVLMGCTYSTASNYMASATLDDGTCIFSGCTDPSADNFNPLANAENGTCVYASPCSMDGNLDGMVNVGDLLILLGEFGWVCP